MSTTDKNKGTTTGEAGAPKPTNENPNVAPDPMANPDPGRLERAENIGPPITTPTPTDKKLDELESQADRDHGAGRTEVPQPPRTDALVPVPGQLHADSDVATTAGATTPEAIVAEMTDSPAHQELAFLEEEMTAVKQQIADLQADLSAKQEAALSLYRRIHFDSQERDLAPARRVDEAVVERVAGEAGLRPADVFALKDLTDHWRIITVDGRKLAVPKSA